jgi:hypothetical protein
MHHNRLDVSKLQELGEKAKISSELNAERRASPIEAALFPAQPLFISLYN